jgi:hypothetical protein
MEHGTDEEAEALRERWAAMERERALTDRLVYGAALSGVGVLLLLLSVPTVACVHGGGVAGAACTTVETPAVVDAALVVVGVVALVGGTWLCWGVLGERRRLRLAELPLQ